MKKLHAPVLKDHSEPMMPAGELTPDKKTRILRAQIDDAIEKRNREKDKQYFERRKIACERNWGLLTDFKAEIIDSLIDKMALLEKDCINDATYQKKCSFECKKLSLTQSRWNMGDKYLANYLHSLQGYTNEKGSRRLIDFVQDIANAIRDHGCYGMVQLTTALSSAENGTKCVFTPWVTVEMSPLSDSKFYYNNVSRLTYVAFSHPEVEGRRGCTLM